MPLFTDRDWPSLKITSGETQGFVVKFNTFIGWLGGLLDEIQAAVGSMSQSAQNAAESANSASQSADLAANVVAGNVFDDDSQAPNLGWSSEKINTALGGRLPKTGGTMTGPLLLSGAPTEDLHPVTKKFFEQNASSVGFAEFLASDAWSKPDGATVVYVELVNGGDGGDVQVRSNGDVAGGQGGSAMHLLLNAADLPASVPVVVAAQGLGAIATTTSGTAQSYSRAKSQGGLSSFNGLECPREVAGPAENVNGFSLYAGHRYGYEVGGTVFGGGYGGTIDHGGVGATVGVSLNHGDGGEAFYRAGFYNIDCAASDGEFPGGGGGSVNCDATTAGVTGTAGDGAAGRVRVWWW